MWLFQTSALLSHLPHSSCICLPPSLRPPSHFPDLVTNTLLLPFYCSRSLLSQQWSSFTFLLSVITTGLVLTSEDLESGPSNKREHLTFLLFQSGLSPSVWSFLVPWTYLQSSGFHFLFSAKQYSVAYMNHISVIHSSVIGHMGCFHFLTIVSGVAMNTNEQVSVK